MREPRSPESSKIPVERAPSRAGAAVPALPIRAGDLVGESYVVEGVIGAGGVGVVVSARHTKLGERVAIKFVQTSAQSEENLSRFEREARAASRIRSEHVARVMDFGSLPGGAPYMVLEHLEGVDLGALLKERGRISFRRAVDYVAHACEGVAEAHALGIVHRDLKPANLFLAKRPDGSDIVKVLDFGISKLLVNNEGRADFAVTQASSVIGSPLYMSPEQMESPRDAKMPSDIWSLGVILYELIAGGPPFEAATMPLLCAKICCGEPTALSQRFATGALPGTSGELYPPPPPELEAAIMRCLQRDPSMRPASVAELVRSIAPFGSAAAQISAERLGRLDGSGLRASDPDLASSSPGLRITGGSTGKWAMPSPGADGAHVSEPVSERRRWSWAEGLGDPPPSLQEKRPGVSRNIAALGVVLALGFGLGAWGMAARVGSGKASTARATAGRSVMLSARSALVGARAWFAHPVNDETAREADPAVPPTAPTEPVEAPAEKKPARARSAPHTPAASSSPPPAAPIAKSGKSSEAGHEITDVLSER